MAQAAALLPETRTQALQPPNRKHRALQEHHFRLPGALRAEAPPDFRSQSREREVPSSVGARALGARALGAGPRLREPGRGGLEKLALEWELE